MTCFPFSCGHRARASDESTVDIDGVSGVGNVKIFKYKELQHATDNFSQLNKIGEGGFGLVYKGKLRDGTMVAVKVLSPESRQGLREFVTELKVLADVEHENLVKIVGCCVEGNNRILVSGYLENNSLSQSLLGQNQNMIDFNWKTRRNICIGIAKGLAFLHEEVRPHIVHRDIKASNILLDRDFTAKISDFGLAKLIPANMTHVSTRVAGTLGYLAPEYALRGQLTRKADTYSFGVLLLEIVCGRCNRNRRLPPGEQHLLQRAWNMFENKSLMELVDEAFREDIDIEETSRFFKIALLCTQEIPKRRPMMSTVVKMLQGEVDVAEMSITRPGLLSEFTDTKPKEHADRNTSSLFSPSSGASSLPSEQTNSSFATITFTSISARSD
ncbi:cold-responsive protein kinase 1-like isoform X1 [Amaranthus tricolor]|uniref:cold-responsive protein kinase 1-like isoform X1 n=1 Tax=Amaranthus tricolor TaxID=29722 RepID=UPI00258CDFAB|nr:cold-responsive protein kinase 1-like isoform X1 [Amaranthus tricolor]XP_057531295.1 cold-responsive protein kinase 1-like isoform X1 [Amaranthus tricolor]XP_057531296.1 cold-responsive protein kinase 1-like isoform X1 [Amaranthus tricolor]